MSQFIANVDQIHLWMKSRQEQMDIFDHAPADPGDSQLTVPFREWGDKSSRPLQLVDSGLWLNEKPVPPTCALALQGTGMLPRTGSR